MPVDADGNRADILTSPDSVPGRMNLGRCHGPFFNAAARDVRKMMLEELGLERNFKGTLSLEWLQCQPADAIDRAVNLMLDYYELTSMYSHKEFTENLSQEERWEWLLNIFNNTLRNFFPIDNQTGPYSEMVKQLEADYFKELNQDVAAKVASKFKLTYGPVTYTGLSGKQVTTLNNVRVAPIYIMLLDKIADSWLAAATGKHNNFGLITAMNNPDKYTRPWHYTAARTVGETEGRLYASYGGPELIAELMDRNGSIATQKEISRNIVNSQDPSNIPSLVDRSQTPYGRAQALQIVGQFNYCLGFKQVYVEEQK